MSDRIQRLRDEAASLAACGDWNGEMAANAYRNGNIDCFARLVLQADALWDRANNLKNKANRLAASVARAPAE